MSRRTRLPTSAWKSSLPARRLSSSRSRGVTFCGLPFDLRRISATRRRSAGDSVSVTCEGTPRATSKTSSQGTARRRVRPGAALRRLGLALALVLAGGDRDERRRAAALDGLLGHDALLDVAPGGQLELHVEQDLLDDRAQAAGAGLALQGAIGDRDEGVVG